MPFVITTTSNTDPAIAGAPLDKNGHSDGSGAVLRDIDAYPILTEEIGYPPSPLARGIGSTTNGYGGGGAQLGQMAFSTVSDVLGWKPKMGDVKGFLGALTQSFDLTDVDGHVDATWKPRTYAIQSDLSGGITGAQASIYSRAKGALDQVLPLLEGIYKLNPNADDSDVLALKALAKSQFTELVNELGLLGGPRVTRVNQYFGLLLGDITYPPKVGPDTPLIGTDPDQIGGTLGELRDELGLNMIQNFVNSVEDEQDLSNFRVISDYITSIAQSWINNLAYFGLNTTKPFFGTRLVLLSRQLSVIGEGVDEVRFALDSVFIGPAERQTMQLTFGTGETPLFVEDLLSWVQGFATEEGPRLIQDGGKLGVSNTFLPVSKRLYHLVRKAKGPANIAAFHTARVKRAFAQLSGQLQELDRLAQSLHHEPYNEPLAVVQVNGVIPNFTLAGQKNLKVSILGQGFEFGGNGGPAVTFAGSGKNSITVPTNFRSENCVVATVPVSNLIPDIYEIQLLNPGESKPYVLPDAFTVE